MVRRMSTLRRLFSVSQANSMLPVVREAFSRARPLYERLVEVRERLTELGHPPGLPAEMKPADDASVQALQTEFGQIAASLQQILTPLLEFGIEVKAADGLVDFRSRFEGREVYLCWKWDEPEVRHFHELDTGFGGRQTIIDPGAFGGELLH